jgi:hypothetical protein
VLNQTTPPGRFENYHAGDISFKEWDIRVEGAAFLDAFLFSCSFCFMVKADRLHSKGSTLAMVPHGHQLPLHDHRGYTFPTGQALHLFPCFGSDAEVNLPERGVALREFILGSSGKAAFRMGVYDDGVFQAGSLFLGVDFLYSIVTDGVGFCKRLYVGRRRLFAVILPGNSRYADNQCQEH